MHHINDDEDKSEENADLKLSYAFYFSFIKYKFTIKENFNLWIVSLDKFQT